MRDIELSLRNGSRIVLRDMAGEPLSGFGQLARLLGVEATAAAPELTPDVYFVREVAASGDWVRISRAASAQGYWSRTEEAFLLRLAEQDKRSATGWAWLDSLAMLLAIASAMLRDNKLLLMHGALLETSRGGVLLCGEGGVGKSTTVRRWRQCGQVAFADDLVLLEYDDTGFVAHPLPTWSQCEKSFDGLCFPANRVVPLLGVLGLARSSEGEELRAVSSADFFAQTYSSSFRFFSLLIRNLPEAVQSALLASVRRGIDAIMSGFPPLALFASLDGDLKKTLKDYL